MDRLRPPDDHHGRQICCSRETSPSATIVPNRRGRHLHREFGLVPGQSRCHDSLRQRNPPNWATNILIDPFNDVAKLNPNSYNLTLHNELMTYEEVVLDMASPTACGGITIPPRRAGLGPNQLYLGRTVERTETHQLVPMIEGRRRWAGWGCSST